MNYANVIFFKIVIDTIISNSRISSNSKPQCSQSENAMLRNNVKNPISENPYDAGDAFDDSVYEDKSKNEAFKRKMSDPELSLIKHAADLNRFDYKAAFIQLQGEPLSPGSDTTGGRL